MTDLGRGVEGLEDVLVALTLNAPWASLVVEGPKDLENRSWPPPAWVIGKRIAIHVGLKTDPFGAQQASTILATLARAGSWRGRVEDWKTADVRGAIIGTAIVTGHVTESKSLWFFGPYAWTLEDRQVLPAPIPCRGYQRIWALTRDVRSQLEASGAP